MMTGDCQVHEVVDTNSTSTSSCTGSSDSIFICCEQRLISTSKCLKESSSKNLEHPDSAEAARNANISEYTDSTGCDPKQSNVSETVRELVSLSTIISNESTKLSLSFCKEPHPSDSDCAALVDKCERTAHRMVSLSRQVGPGQSLKQLIREAVCELLDNLARFMGLLSGGGPFTPHQHTGMVWKSCRAFAKLPTSHAEAVVRLVDSSRCLVADALKELEDCVKDEITEIVEEVEDEAWSSYDKDLVSNSVGLIKVIVNVLKKTSQSISSKGYVDSDSDQLDITNKLSAEISNLVDDFVISLYPPLRYDNVSGSAETLANDVRQLLAHLRGCYFVDTADSKWLDFLDKAVDHNLVKVRQDAGRVKSYRQTDDG